MLGNYSHLVIASPSTKKPRVIALSTWHNTKLTEFFKPLNAGESGPNTKLTKSSVSEVLLSREQREVVRLAESGVSFFFTGVAGTGKTFVLKHLADLYCMVDPGNLAITSKRTTTFFTALTGTAAAQLERASTLHAWAGFMGGGGMERCYRQAQRNPQARQRWIDCKCLFIDEISMMSADLLETLDFVAKKIRKNPRLLFGGIQLILSGDFLQLPPIGGEQVRRCYESTLWKSVISRTVELKTVFRQKDMEFIKFLWRLRTNSLSPCDFNQLRALTRPLRPPQGVEPLKLTPHRRTADLENQVRLHALPGEEVVYMALDSGPDKAWQLLDQHTTLPVRMRLKKGAQVMLLKNVAKLDLVNGSLGIVQDFVKKGAVHIGVGPPSSVGVSVMPVVRFGDKEVVVGWDKFVVEDENLVRMQLPLLLAWTCTIHKSQGMTADFLEVDLSEIFEFGQAYVALSRCRGFEGLRVLGFNALRMKSNPEIIKHLSDNHTVLQDAGQRPKKGTALPKTKIVKEDECQPKITNFFRN